MSRARVTAVVWTYNRYAVLEGCLAAIAAQTAPVDRVIVVDSASPDLTARRLATEHVEVDVVVLRENDGMGAAIRAGLDLALGDPRVSHVWLVEDDSRPAPDCLEAGLRLLRSRPTADIVGPVGADLHRGQWRWRDLDHTGWVDFCILDGALYRADLLRRVTPPDPGYFIMLVDVEYPLRLRQAGARTFMCPDMRVDALRLGASSASSSWRAYYQTRNHLRMALDLRSAELLAGFAVRTAKQVAVPAAPGSPRGEVLRYRFRGVADALRNRMGRRIEP